jgi:hypothetical protein
VIELLHKMGSEKVLEKMEDNEEHALESSSPTLCSDPEKAEDPEMRRQDDSNGNPDSDHEEVEAMNAGHQVDLAIQQVCLLRDGQQSLL